ncbi:MAG TPA: monooxygenase [Actinomycetota bacterium]
MTRWPRVGVVGGSLGGLTSALLLRDLGCEVDVFERSTAELESRGAGIVVLDETLRYLRERTPFADDDISIRTSTLRYLGPDGSTVFETPKTYRYSGWRTIHRALLSRFPPERYHLASEVVGFEASVDDVHVDLAPGLGSSVELLVCADGIGSASRTRLLPDVRAIPAGYVAWRGTVAEEVLDPHEREAFRDALVYQAIPASHILVYPIPNLDGSTEPGRRLLNFVWYRNYADQAFDLLMTGRDGSRRETTVPPGEVALGETAEMRGSAAIHLAPQLAAVVQATDRPFVQAIFDIEVPRMAFGRVCLIGDAAFALRPHIAAGTAKASDDGWALAGALEASDGDVPTALRVWEERQLVVGRRALIRSRRNGNRSQFEGTWRPEDPDLAFGLRGALR